MPKVDQTPIKLRPFFFHGVNLIWNDDKTGEAVGDCPFCGKEGKFSVNVETGLYRCFVCATGTEKGGGNAHTFIRKLWEVSDQGTTDYAELARDRGLMNPESLAVWGICKSAITGEWLVPGYGPERNLNQLYKYIYVGGRKRLLPTPTLGHQLFGLNGTYDPKRPDVYVCEGVWDAIALWEVLSQTKAVDGKLLSTANAEAALGSKVNLVAVPGCQSLKYEHWHPVFSGKNVSLLYDNDHDKEHPTNGTLVMSAGYRGMMMATHILSAIDKPPTSVNYLCWSGQDGKTFEESLPSGYDIRDYLKSSGNALGLRINAWSEIKDKVRPTPSEWLGEAPRGLKSDSRVEGLVSIPCNRYETVVEAWKNALKWIDGLDYAFSVMLASIVSTQQVGDQLWIKVIGPASSGKSTLCEAVSVSRKYVLAISTMRGFHSGYDDGSGEDRALLARVSGKTLVTKDGDTLLQSPNLEQILSEARDVYDTVSRTSFRNKSSREYTGVRMTWLLCGTSSLRSLDSSELGERFLDCVIMEKIDDDLEDEILIRQAQKSDRNMSLEANSDIKKQQEPEMTEVMQLTGGYVNYLRENATRLLSEVQLTDEDRHLCTRLGKFVAFMRARPSRRQDENHERELAARLVSQHIRLMKSLCAVLNTSSVNENVLGRVRRVCMDTSRGVTLDIVRHLYRSPQAHVGVPIESLIHATNKTEDRTKTLLRFLKSIGVVEVHQERKHGVRGPRLYKLSRKISLLYHQVTGELQEIED